MNIFASSGVTTSSMDNTKSLFTNMLPFENSPDVDLYFKSARLDTRVSFLRYSTAPRLVVETRGDVRIPRGYVEGSDYIVCKKERESQINQIAFMSNVFESESFAGYLDLLQHALNSLTVNPDERVLVTEEPSLGGAEEKTFSIFQNCFFMLFFPEHAHKIQYFKKTGSSVFAYKMPTFTKKIRISELFRTVKFVRLYTSTRETSPRFCYNIKDYTLTPRLVKIFCTQLEESQALTSDSCHLMTVVPYKAAKYYNHTAVSSPSLKLRPKLSSICFKLTDENNRQLDLLTGVPSFIHFLAEPRDITMTSVSCYFSSGNALSALHYPENSQSAFHQILSTSIDSRRRRMTAILHNIYIPQRVLTLSPNYTQFALEYDSSDVENSVSLKSGTVKMPPGSYTQNTFLEKFNIGLSGNQIKMELNHGRIRLINSSQTPVNILFPPELAHMLGVVNYISLKPVKVPLPPLQYITANHVFKSDAVRSRVVKVMCNILSPSVFAGRHQQILRILDIDDTESSSDHEKGVLLTFPAPHEVKIREGIYNKIEFELLDENDTRIEFEDKTIPVEGFLSIRDSGGIL